MSGTWAAAGLTIVAISARKTANANPCPNQMVELTTVAGSDLTN